MVLIPVTEQALLDQFSHYPYVDITKCCLYCIYLLLSNLFMINLALALVQTSLSVVYCIYFYYMINHHDS